MTFLESFVLGIVQGLGEFLPISSSGHLVVVPWFMDFKDPGLSFDVALHFGTLFALIAYFWRDWVVILSGAKNLPMEVVRLFKRSAPTPAGSGSSHLFLLLIVSAIPGGVAGVFLDIFGLSDVPHLLAFGLSAAVGLFKGFGRISQDVESSQGAGNKRAGRFYQR